MRVSLIAATLGLLVGHGLATSNTMTVCNENNCLRAVQGSAYPTRHGTADCSSYFRATVTPATTTVTTTITVYTPTTAVQDVTATTILDVTLVETSEIAATSTLDVTVVQTSEETATSTVDATLIETVDITVSTTVTTAVSTATLTSTIISVTILARGNDRGNMDLQPRQATVVPTSIPSYASACSGSVGYSSACSCVGVTISTITAATPTTTATVMVTSPSIVSIQTTTDATVIVTTTDSTTVFSTTDSTLIVSETETSTFTTIDATVAITVTDGTSIFSTTVATATTVVSTTVTDIIPEATYYPQCAPSNLIGSYNGVGIIQIVASTSITIAAAQSAYDCCVECLTKPSCGAAGYSSSVSQCYLIGNGGTCSASHQDGVFNTASTEAPNGGIIVSNTPCGKLVFGQEIG
ncbi:hypothetical protein MMC11_007931 [Xylographa trunciseda]|nr:hypothetical protein [Xylographa trunciseda]